MKKFIYTMTVEVEATSKDAAKSQYYSRLLGLVGEVQRMGVDGWHGEEGVQTTLSDGSTVSLREAGKLPPKVEPTKVVSPKEPIGTPIGGSEGASKATTVASGGLKEGDGKSASPDVSLSGSKK
jgi:hypothetical protein